MSAARSPVDQEKGWVKDDGIRISEVERLRFVSREVFRGLSAEEKLC